MAGSISAFQRLLRDSNLFFDVEFGNADGFFSGSKNEPTTYPVTDLTAGSGTNAVIKRAHLKVADCFEDCGEGSIRRHVRFTVVERAELYDLVSRFVVTDRSRQRVARINGIEVPHRCTNLYHQYSSGSVTVPVGTEDWITFSGTQEGMPMDAFDHVFYVRDESSSSSGNRWIVHHRVIASSEAQRLVIRGCHPWFERPLPDAINSRIPLFLRKRLFRIRETALPNFPLMAVGENTLTDGQRICLRTKLALHG